MTISLKMLVLFVCLPYVCIQVICNGLIATSVSSLQTRYMFSGVDIGLIFGMFDLGCVLALIIVAFVGDDANKPRWLGVSSLIVGIGALLFTVPHFAVPDYEYETSDFNNYCGNVTEPDCQDKGLKKYMGIFILSMLIAGGGFAPIFTYGITYIDDNTNTRDSSIYVSVFYLMSAIGPVIGFVMGGSFTERFVQPMKDVSIDSSNPFWVGAWWPGYLICGAFAILSAIPVLRLPKKIAKNDKESNTPKVPDKPGKETGKLIRVVVIKELLLNPIFMLATLNVALTQAFVLGFNSFGVKYMESQFGLSTFVASIIYGSAAVFFVVCGHVTSAIVMGKYKLEVSGLVKYCVICACLSVVFTFGFFFYCEDDKFAGGTVKYSTDEEAVSTFQLISSCNAHCGCTADWHNPVRGSDGVVYYSPCYAGCEVSLSTNVTTYENCSCILNDDFNRTSGVAIVMRTTSEKFCPKLIGFLFGFGLAIYTSILTVSPTTQITIRHVGEQYKSAAMGLQQLLALVLGNIPGRIITGKVLDTACVAWSTKCGVTASCKVYKKWDMALYTFLLLICETAVIFLLFLVIYFIDRSSKKTQTTKLKQPSSSMNTVF